MWFVKCFNNLSRFVWSVKQISVLLWKLSRSALLKVLTTLCIATEWVIGWVIYINNGYVLVHVHRMLINVQPNLQCVWTKERLNWHLSWALHNNKTYFQHWIGTMISWLLYCAKQKRKVHHQYIEPSIFQNRVLTNWFKIPGSNSVIAKKKRTSLELGYNKPHCSSAKHRNYSILLECFWKSAHSS